MVLREGGEETAAYRGLPTSQTLHPVTRPTHLEHYPQRAVALVLPVALDLGQEALDDGLGGGGIGGVKGGVMLVGVFEDEGRLM